jgi:hypothetical protein
MIIPHSLVETRNFQCVIFVHRVIDYREERIEIKKEHTFSASGKQ